MIVKFENANFRITIPDRTYPGNLVYLDNPPEYRPNFDEITIFCKRTNRFIFVLSVEDAIKFLEELEGFLKDNGLSMEQFIKHMKFNACDDYLRNSLFDEFLREFDVRITVFDYHNYAE